MIEPYFSIIIPTYNRAHCILKTIESVMVQDFDQWEIILVDDGSTDETESVIKNLNNPKIRYFKKENGERGAARNFGAKLAKGNFINFFDSDDLMYPFHLSEAYKELIKNPHIKCLCFPWEYYSSEGKFIGRRTGFDQDLNQIVQRKNWIHLNGAFIERNLFLAHPFIEDRKFIICEDWYFFLQLSFYTKLAGINKPTTKYILHDDSTMNNMKPESFHVALLYFEKLLQVHTISASNKRAVFAELYSMLSLAYAVNQSRTKSVRYFCKAVMKRSNQLFTKRTLGIFKNIIYAKRRS